MNKKISLRKKQFSEPEQYLELAIENAMDVVEFLEESPKEYSTYSEPPEELNLDDAVDAFEAACIYLAKKYKVPLEKLLNFNIYESELPRDIAEKVNRAFDNYLKYVLGIDLEKLEQEGLYLEEEFSAQSRKKLYTDERHVNKEYLDELAEEVKQRLDNTKLGLSVPALATTGILGGFGGVAGGIYSMKHYLEQLYGHSINWDLYQVGQLEATFAGILGALVAFGIVAVIDWFVGRAKKRKIMNALMQEAASETIRLLEKGYPPEEALPMVREYTLKRLKEYLGK